MNCKVTVVLGAQWGDEGKGKMVDILAANADIVCRCQGGNNADHAVVVDGIEYVFHLVPVGIATSKCISVIEKTGAEMDNKVTVVLGAQWGDEGKGKVTDMLAANADVVCRCQGGSNADHTVVADGVQYMFNLVPVGFATLKCISVIGNGVVVHLPSLFEELEKHADNGLRGCQNRLVVSDKAHLVFDFHQQLDLLQELEKVGTGQEIGTTRRGIGPTYSSKAARNGIRLGDLLGDYPKFSQMFEALVALSLRTFPNLAVDIDAELEKYKTYAEKIRPYVKETVSYLHKCIEEGKKVVVEGANAGMLDIDFGTYPCVTSSNCSIGGVCTGLGLPPSKIGEIIGVVKSYTTRVAVGPFPTELNNDIGELLQQRGNEVGKSKIGKIRCGWLDVSLLKYTNMVNGYTVLCFTNLDILDVFPEIKVGVGYSLKGEKIEYFPSSISDWYSVKVEYITMPGWQSSTEHVREFNDLPKNARLYVEKIQELLQVPVKWIGVGRGRDAIITVK